MYTKEDIHGIAAMYECLSDRVSEYRKWEDAIALYDQFRVSEYNLPCFTLENCVRMFANGMALRGIKL